MLNTVAVLELAWMLVLRMISPANVSFKVKNVAPYRVSLNEYLTLVLLMGCWRIASLLKNDKVITHPGSMQRYGEMSLASKSVRVNPTKSLRRSITLVDSGRIFEQSYSALSGMMKVPTSSSLKSFASVPPQSTMQSTRTCRILASLSSGTLAASFSVSVSTVTLNVMVAWTTVLYVTVSSRPTNVKSLRGGGKASTYDDPLAAAATALRVLSR
mmetsp:Transcript_18721/g.59681  ORF Transcript_18721/g.59681 Transcript_18721/m.59681 type:complete len:214 (+) Transcript_18721:679-1320(+)